ncbi:MAG: G1 family glutamic endopeptidase [Candidatus Limnocylindrales bacterium]
MAPTPPPTPATIPTIFTITAGQQAIITTTGAPGTSVQVQTLTDLVTWSGLATVTVDPSGRASYTFVPPKTAYYRAYFFATQQVSTPVRGVVLPARPTPAPPSPPPVAQPFCPAPRCMTLMTNWSGYSVGLGPYSEVERTFTVPNLAATPTETRTAKWVGIGGINTASRIQAGVTERYDPGTRLVYLHAWYEVLLAPEMPISTVSVKPGDAVTITIWQIGGTLWRITLTDDTSGAQPFTTVQTYSGPPTPADWIVEAPTPLTTRTVEPLGEYTPPVTFSDPRIAGQDTTAAVYVMQQDGVVVSVPSALTSAGSTVAYGAVAPQRRNRA